jgi:hypothetical protein
MLTDEQQANRRARLQRLEAGSVNFVSKLDVERLLALRGFHRSCLPRLDEVVADIEDDRTLRVIEINAIQRRLYELGYKGE